MRVLLQKFWRASAAVVLRDHTPLYEKNVMGLSVKARVCEGGLSIVREA